MDIRLALITGIDIPIPELQISIHQPTMKDISYMGEQDFFTAVHHICLDKEALVEDKVLLENLTNFQVLMKVLEQSKDASEKKLALTTLLSLLFPSYQAMFTPNSIILRNAETSENVLIDKDSFQYLQNMIKEVCCVNNIFQGNNIVYKPANARAKAIADKIMRGRQKAAAAKGGENFESVFSRYISILTIGTSSMSLKDCTELTMYQLFDLVERYTLYTGWDIDLRVRLAGGDPKSEADNWMKNIH